MLKLIKMELKKTSFKWFNIMAISLMIYLIILTLIFKTDKLNNVNGIYFLSIIIFLFTFEDNKINILLNSLPVNKIHIVLKDYIFLFVSFLLSIIYNYMYIFILKNISTISMNYITLNEFVIALSIVIIQLSIVLSILHFSSNIISYIIVFSVLLFGRIIIIRGFDEAIAEMVLNGKGHIIFLLALLIMAVSISISIFFYSNREFEGR